MVAGVERENLNHFRTSGGREKCQQRKAGKNSGPHPTSHPNSADLTELSWVTIILDTHHCLTLDALGCPLWKREFQRARWGSDEEIHKKQNCSFLLSHFLPYLLSFPYACWDIQSHLVCQQVGEAIASHELSSLPHLSSLQLCMESCISLFSTWVFTCSYVSERKILSVGDLTSWGEKKKKASPLICSSYAFFKGCCQQGMTSRG